MFFLTLYTFSVYLRKEKFVLVEATIVSKTIISQREVIVFIMSSVL